MEDIIIHYENKVKRIVCPGKDGGCFHLWGIVCTGQYCRERSLLIVLHADGAFLSALFFDALCKQTMEVLTH